MPGIEELPLEAQGALRRLDPPPCTQGGGSSVNASRYAPGMPAFLPVLALLLTAAAPRAATFANPVLDADFPDPAVLRASDGFYYAFATQAEREGRKVN